ncbi:MAG: anhydro-N-acetylmuramic acid kinase [Flavobacteriaceae bacterium]|nr:anhydro-N-acetylmuramic acid kinase [Flavobacteriaceae bacterium]
MLNHDFFAIGMMSGTSLDGVDLVYVHFNTNGKYRFEILHSETISYEKQWQKKLKDAYNSSEDLDSLNEEYGRFLGNLISRFIEKHKILKIDFVASHGHTIFHQPENGFTLQIGDGQQISNITNLKVICDFRSQDVALKGQGAPLVPIGDRLLFNDYDYCLNLGGFANISYEEDGNRIANDVCPVNIVLNHYVQKLGYNYDNHGLIASKGICNMELLHELNHVPYYSESPPKSLGLEWVKTNIFPLIDGYDIEIKDILRTFIEHVSIQISNLFQEEGKLVLVTGGGVFNEFLVSKTIQKSKAIMIIPDKEIIEFKEALIFAFLGLLKIKEKVNVLSSVTGAKKDHSSGQIFIPKN